MKKIIASPLAPKAVGPYSQAVESGSTLYISGQLPIDAATGTMPETIEEQTATVEAQIAEYDAKFATATEYDSEAYKAYDALKQQLDHLMHEWEKASYELEITENQ